MGIKNQHICCCIASDFNYDNYDAKDSNDEGGHNGVRAASSISWEMWHLPLPGRKEGKPHSPPSGLLFSRRHRSVIGGIVSLSVSSTPPLLLLNIPMFICFVVVEFKFEWCHPNITALLSTRPWRNSDQQFHQATDRLTFD